MSKAAKIGWWSRLLECHIIAILVVIFVISTPLCKQIGQTPSTLRTNWMAYNTLGWDSTVMYTPSLDCTIALLSLWRQDCKNKLWLQGMALLTKPFKTLGKPSDGMNNKTMCSIPCEHGLDQHSWYLVEVHSSLQYILVPCLTRGLHDIPSLLRFLVSIAKKRCTGPWEALGSKTITAHLSSFIGLTNCWSLMFQAPPFAWICWDKG